MTRIQKLKAEMKVIRHWLDYYNSKSQKYRTGVYSTQVNKLLTRERNILTNINQENQKALP